MSFEEVNYSKNYNSPGKCRFYIDMGLYLYTIGLWNAEYLFIKNVDLDNTRFKKRDYANLFNLDPSKKIDIPIISEDIPVEIGFPVIPRYSKFDYIALLNHNFFDAVSSDGASFSNADFFPGLYNGAEDTLADLTYTHIINAEDSTWASNNAIKSRTNGYSISTFGKWTGATVYDYNNWGSHGKPTFFTEDMPNKPVGSIYQPWPNIAMLQINPNMLPGNLHLGAISMGYTWDTPTSPEISFTMERSFEGIDKYSTKGGAQLHNIRYTGPPSWGEAAPWQLWNNTDNTGPYSGGQFQYPEKRGQRVGRRSWTLEFPAIVQENMVPMWESFNQLERPTTIDTSVIPTDSSLSPEMQGSDFLTSVLNRTLGGTLPFIFQPDVESSKQGDFAICRLDTDSFTIKQSAHNIFDLSMKITETW
tara:strand:- start:355 stop:1608 length:1254 start_codon:yes stop_codon:yes gene_type:complete